MLVVGWFFYWWLVGSLIGSRLVLVLVVDRFFYWWLVGSLICGWLVLLLVVGWFFCWWLVGSFVGGWLVLLLVVGWFFCWWLVGRFFFYCLVDRLFYWWLIGLAIVVGLLKSLTQKNNLEESVSVQQFNYEKSSGYNCLKLLELASSKLTMK